MYNSQKRTSYNFQCFLVSTADPSQYMLGDARGKGMNETKLKQLKEKFKPGLVFHMSKIEFANNVNQQYNSTPKTEVISMLNTTWSPVLVSVGKPNMAEPAIPIVASMEIEAEQRFDALALIQHVSETSPGGKTLTGQQRVRCSVFLNDGSYKKDTSKVCHLPVTIFADATSDEEEPLLFKQLREAAKNKTAMAFFGIQGKKSTTDTSFDKWSFLSSFDFFCENASNTMRGKQLEAQATELGNAEAETVPQSVLQSRSNEENEKFEDKAAMETTCALLKSMLVNTNIEAIESSTTFWHINWCRVHPPPKDAQISTSDDSRLWMLVKAEDDTGHVSIFMREQAALSLACVDSKEEFEARRADDTLEFPTKASIKIIRKPAGFQTTPKKDSAGKPAMSCYIVEATEQEIGDTPSKSSMTLIQLLEQTKVDTDACAPASLSMIKKDPHYGLSITYMVGGEPVKKRCTRAVVLVSATRASVPTNMNEGYQMITERVRDPLDDSFECTLMSFCTVKTSADYQLKPARGAKTQTAFAVIADVLEDGSAGKPSVFLVETLSRIPIAEAEAAPEHMRRRIQFAAFAAKVQGKSKQLQWTEDVNPAIAGKCRRLGKAPTNEQMEQYEFSRCSADKPA